MKPKAPKRRGKAAAAHPDFLEGLLDSTRLVVYLKDVDGRYLYVNRRYELLSTVPREALLGKRDHDLFPAKVADLFRAQDNEVAALRKSLEFEETVPLPSGEHSFVTEKFPLFDGKGEVYATGGFCTEITTQKNRADESLAEERERLAVSMHLAGGIAHDFNNLVTGIVCNLELLGEELPAAGSARELLKDARSICGKASALSRRLLTFADGAGAIHKTFSPGPLLGETARLILNASNVKPLTSVPAGLWPIDGDEAQFIQVLVNLLVNAREAMPGGGTVWIGGENRVLTRPMLHLPAGRYVSLTVRDDGPGIPPAIMDRVFEPCVSSKARGSGLGLAIVHSVVRGHRGHVWAESPAEGGSLFTVLLPASAKGPRKAAKPALRKKG